MMSVFSSNNIEKTEYSTSWKRWREVLGKVENKATRRGDCTSGSPTDAAISLEFPPVCGETC